MANLAIVSGGVFITPPEGNILLGTTLVSSMEFLESIGVPVYRENITVDEAYAASEVMLLGGDSCVAVTSLNDRKIGRGKVGDVAAKIKEHLKHNLTRFL
jgi:branched-subunit amino acid aminotransferase/4-amino-4-deoxychorismate lyase